ncbi:MAG TPA: DEAD/DEAH box helicase [Gammaproteobacteria bacterium]|nr:DEAD/DEAH box helicase [Gammaproteobacteria bacterium]
MERHLTATTFASLGLAEPLLAALTELGFTHCTPIQAQALPLALGGADVAGQAQTGTGKTACFLLALFHRLLTRTPAGHRRPNQPRALIVAPTRELAVQIHHDAELLGRHAGFTLGLVYGGEDYVKQRERLAAGVDVLIGTPGRLIDYLKQNAYDLKAVEVVVIDEADRMFDMGFIRDIRFLLRRLPPYHKRLSMLFSATLSHRVMELAYEHMNNPVFVRIEPERITAEKVREVVYLPAMGEKIPLLIGLLRHLQPSRSIVFVNTKRAADEVAAYLRGNGFSADVLSGDVPQKKRLRLLREFQGGELAVLVTTDVASRGLHVPAVSHVFNYDLPQDPEDYVHRIGRTARAGAEGDAISFACEEYAFSLPDIEKFIGHPILKQTQHAAFVASGILPPVSEAPRRRPHHPKGAGGRRRARRRRN